MTDIILDAHTPLMRQYHAIKQQYPDALLLFQVGDFYELFFDDAKKAAACLAITLTKRGKINGEPIPLCGVPVHALDHYLTKLIKAGFKVALCDQLEQATPGKVVERGVTQLLTPGTLTDTQLLDAKSASYLFSFFPQENYWGLLFGELLTAQLFATVVPANAEKLVETELARFFPDEILVPNNALGKMFQPFFQKLGYFCSYVDVAQDTKLEQPDFLQHFNVASRNYLNTHDAAKMAWLNFHAYIGRTQQHIVSQFTSINFYSPEDFLLLDAATQRNLELIKNNKDGTKQHTLFETLDGAVTPMGSRMIKKWIMRPLVHEETLLARQQAVAHYVHTISDTHALEALLEQLGDIERVVGRIALRRAVMHDYVVLMHALEKIPEIQHLLQRSSNQLLMTIKSHVADFTPLKNLLQSCLNDDTAREWIIKKGFDQRLDELRDLIDNGTSKVLELEQKEQQLTGISSLKIRHNDLYGYYIEITKTHMHAIPDRYDRRQSLVGRERFTTKELQSLEQDLYNARAHVEQAEQELFERIKYEVNTTIAPLRRLAHGLAHLDALVGLARVAYNNGYVCPEFNHTRDILIAQGRHPVVEGIMTSSFIENDSALTDEQSLLIITGPNMGGKSTYLRQVALLSIMAQIGSFVSAKKASLPILDRIFTRIGAGDNLAEGKSTFLVEMEETATICTQATRNSLVILDEVGRGTSTIDGLALAQAIVEYLYAHVQARCLFATHYHELTALQDRYPGIKSYYAASKKTQNGIIFLYKIILGVADGSFGIEVAKIAQLPRVVIERAQEIVDLLEFAPAARASSIEHHEPLPHKQRTEDVRITLLATIDYDNLSPKAAFDILWKLRELE